MPLCEAPAVERGIRQKKHEILTSNRPPSVLRLGAIVHEQGWRLAAALLFSMRRSLMELGPMRGRARVQFELSKTHPKSCPSPIMILVRAAHHQRQASAPPRLVSHRQSPTDWFRGGLVTSVEAWWWSATNLRQATTGRQDGPPPINPTAEPVVAGSSSHQTTSSTGREPLVPYGLRSDMLQQGRSSPPSPSLPHAMRGQQQARTPRTKRGRDGQPYGEVPAAWFAVGTLLPDSERRSH